MNNPSTPSIPPSLSSHEFNRIPVIYDGRPMLLVSATFKLKELSTLLGRLRTYRRNDHSRKATLHPDRGPAIVVPLYRISFLSDRQTLDEISLSPKGCVSKATKEERVRYRSATPHETLKTPLFAVLLQKTGPVQANTLLRLYPTEQPLKIRAHLLHVHAQRSPL